MKKIYRFFVCAVLALCACNGRGLEPAPQAYHFEARLCFQPQTKGVTFGNDGESISTQFEETDCVYIYNETKKAYARKVTGELIALHPRNISGAYCNLTGELLFRVWDKVTKRWTLVAIEEGDTYALYYQMNIPSPGEDNIPSHDYGFQDCGQETASGCDFAQATGVAIQKSASSLSVPEGVVLENMQSMFRLRLSYTNGGVPAVPATISALSINTKNGTLVETYAPTDDPDDRYLMSGFTLGSPAISADGDIYLALAFRYDDLSPAEGDELILTVRDAEGNVYRGSKAVPTDGFVNSKYYYGDVTMAWLRKDAELTITCGEGVSYDLYSDGNYDFDSSNPDPASITISGSGSGYYLTFTWDATITLKGNGTAIYYGTDPFIYLDGSGDGITTIILDGNYTIDCRNNDTAIWADWSYLLLKTTGDEQTLTVIANDPDYKGLYGYLNYYNGSNPATLSATDFTVTLTSTTPGPDEDGDEEPDYYTWVYTVTPFVA